MPRPPSRLRLEVDGGGRRVTRFLSGGVGGGYRIFGRMSGGNAWRDPSPPARSGSQRGVATVRSVGKPGVCEPVRRGREARRGRSAPPEGRRRSARAAG
jgi:hypothetical protein